MYQLCREVGGRTVCFTIAKPSGFFDTEHLVVSVDGSQLASFNLIRGGVHDGPPRQACLVEGLRGCVDRSAESAGVRVECRSGAPYVECAVQLYQSETKRLETSENYGAYVRKCITTVVSRYKWTWRVQVGLLGLAEARAPERQLLSAVELPSCWYERRYSPDYYGRIVIVYSPQQPATQRPAPRPPEPPKGVSRRNYLDPV